MAGLFWKGIQICSRGEVGQVAGHKPTILQPFQSQMASIIGTGTIPPSQTVKSSRQAQQLPGNALLRKVPQSRRDHTIRIPHYTFHETSGQQPSALLGAE